MLNIIRKLINKRIDKPCQVIQGYSNNPQPPKPFATVYLINHIAQDEYSNISEERMQDEVKELMIYNGEFTVQFDVLGNTEEETIQKARELRELITYKMRYQEWAINGIGVINNNYSMKPFHEKADTGEYIYRISFDITFESRISMERLTELAKTIDLKLKNKNIIIGGK